MTTLAYLRVSKDSQDVRNQRLAILEFAQREQVALSDFLEVTASARRSPKARQLDVVLTRLAAGDTLVVSEISRLGRSVGEIITVIDALVKRHVRFVAIKEGIRLEGRQDVQSKVLVTLFSLFADIERELMPCGPRRASPPPEPPGNALAVLKANWAGPNSPARKTRFAASYTSRCRKRRLPKLPGLTVRPWRIFCGRASCCLQRPLLPHRNFLFKCARWSTMCGWTGKANPARWPVLRTK